MSHLTLAVASNCQSYKSEGVRASGGGLVSCLRLPAYCILSMENAVVHTCMPGGVREWRGNPSFYSIIINNNLN